MRSERITFYRRYLERCNDHRFEQLGEFVDEQVRVNDEPVGLEQYIAGLQAVVAAFPDYHWELRHLLVDGDWLATHLTGTGTHAGPFLGVPATGRPLVVPELAMYRLVGGRIAESWGDLGTTARDRLTSGVPD